MDLNESYHQHQIAVMNAAAATSRPRRERMLDRARGIALDIARFQHGAGAGAAAMWNVPLAARNAA
ncbi:hypothetical protein [Novosphingobium sp.]|uniref:hypothetical protein n=1 Tax=Novosphingobium sp. TaxID=1874826 RepID=UPI001EC4C86D|nr:hypothetical protein [Novosphingobium sp.]MBK6801757.1 hypothetical protein [Novosphingobium sp.]MBK9010402.1 hypothetical protein [Novosphingobium sp.]